MTVVPVRPMVEVESLHKSFGSFECIKGMSLTVEQAKRELISGIEQEALHAYA